jgi:3-isopropylmalate/(R)-2-methylmalate dehydratase large subunit
MGRSLFEKIWDNHLVHDLGDGFGLIFVDRQLLTELATPQFDQLDKRGLPLLFPECTFAVSDHTVATLRSSAERAAPRANSWTRAMREKSEKFAFTHFDVDSPMQGISSVTAPEIGLVLPGSTFTVLDSHSCTVGALGAAAWASCAGDVLHTLATQTSILKKPPLMRITLDGHLGNGVTAKDMMLYVIRQLGIAGGAGFAIEFAGAVIRGLPMEGRFTVCNLAVELGARFALVAPDQTTVDYLKGRPYAPAPGHWDAAVRDWLSLASDADARFDREVTLDVSDIEPQISWGSSPQDVISVCERIPDPAHERDQLRRAQIEAALAYAGLGAGASIEGTPIDFVFIGSCANNRISDLRQAAQVAHGRKVADNVVAWVIPGSQAVRAQAEAEGLDEVFRAAGFQWGEPGCSMCGGQGNGFTEILKPRMRAVSTINRNFPNRQGPNSITHLASPPMAAAAAVCGQIVDVRKMSVRA